MQSTARRLASPVSSSLSSSRTAAKLSTVIVGALVFASLLPASLGAQASDYSNPESWLCHPDREQDACDTSLDTTVVHADGRLEREVFVADPNAPIDCFYVYPTVSNDPGGNSDMQADAEELNVIQSQFARFGSVCRPFAPLYRQVTLTALRAMIGGQSMDVDRALGYNDVVAAWSHYLEYDNDGRGVVLIGHSQGAGVLNRLIQSEIDGKGAQKTMISALLLGTTLAVDKGKETGTFEHVPVCTSASQIGCVIAYASFRDTVPPPANTRFGRTREEGREAACANPASLEGGAGELHAYLRSSGNSNGSALPPGPWVKDGSEISEIETPFVSVPGLLTAECVEKDGAHVLSVTVHGDPSDPRTDDISGDVVRGGVVAEDWGLHLIDVDLAMGDLLTVVREQTKSYLEKSGASSN